MGKGNGLLIGLGAAAGGFLLLKGLGGGGGVGTAILGNDLASMLATAAANLSPALFRSVIHKEALPYADVILRVAREQGVSPFLIEALGWRESKWGTARELDQPGPGGRGDAGHGHGLMQVDDRSHGSWLASHDWTDPYTILSYAISAVLKPALAFFAGTSAIRGVTDGAEVSFNHAQAVARGIDFEAAGGESNDTESEITLADPRPLDGDRLITASIAAYNTGIANVLRSLAAGASPDTTTAEGDYSSDVLANATRAARSAVA